MNCEHYLVRNTNIEAYGLSITGQVRKANEDSCGFATVPNGELFVVCDGMGGHVGGATASRIAVDQIIEHFKAQRYPNIYQALNDALCRANIQIIGAANADPSLKGMGTTACIVLVDGHDAYIAHVGDSRIYLFEAQKQRLFRITKDHSFVQSLVDMGQLDDREAEHHPRKNVIMKALGIKEDLHPEVFMSPVQPAKGDMFMICSDGLSGMVDDDGIEAIMGSDQSTEQKVMDLVTNANVPGKGLDNITAQIIKVVESPYPVSNHPDHNPAWRKGPDAGPTLKQQKNPSRLGAAQEAPAKKKTKMLLAILIPAVVLLLLIGGGVAAYFIWWHGKDKGKVEPIEPKPNEIEEPVKPEQPNDKNDNTARLLEEKEKMTEEALKAKAETDKKLEQTRKELEQIKKENEKNKAEVEQMKKDEAKSKAKEETNSKVKPVSTKSNEETNSKVKPVPDNKKPDETPQAQDGKALKDKCDRLKDAVVKLQEKDAKQVCTKLGVNAGLSAKTELVKEVQKAYEANNSARLDEIDKAIKNIK